MRKYIVTALFCLTVVPLLPAAPAAARHDVLMVWGGMRPDFVNASNTPTLYELSKAGVFFAKNHPVYVSSTEVNGTGLATGAYPEHSGIIGNREFRPDLDPSAPIGTESLEAMRQADRQGKYLAAPTIAETLQSQGYSTVIAETKPDEQKHKRADRPDNATNIVLYEGKTLPAKAVAGITNALGRFFDKGITKTNRDLRTARALTEILWAMEVPAFSLLW